jgi:hypothetical protein
VGEKERAAVRRAFQAAEADAVFVDGLAPIVPLLVAQIEQALNSSLYDQRRLVALSASTDRITVEVGSPCRARLTAHRLGRFHRAHTRELFEGRLVARPPCHRCLPEGGQGGSLRGRPHHGRRARGTRTARSEPLKKAVARNSGPVEWPEQWLVSAV